MKGFALITCFVLTFATIAKAVEFTDEQLLEQMESIVADLELDLTAAKKDSETVKTQLQNEKKAHEQAQIEADKHQKEVREVTAWGNEKSKLAEYWYEKERKAVKKLWWWRIWGWAAIALSAIILIGSFLLKFTVWGAQTFGPVIKKFI